MMKRKLNSTDYPILFLLVDSNDHITGKTGLTDTPVVTLSKNGATPMTIASGAVSEIGNGWYALAGDATDRNTLGELGIHVAIAGADPCDMKFEIGNDDPFADLATIVADYARRTGDYATAGAAMDLIDAPNEDAVAVIQAGLSTLDADDLPPAPDNQGIADIVAVLPSTTIAAATDLPVAPDNQGISDINTKTTNLPDDPASQSAVESAIDGISIPTPPTKEEIAGAVLDEAAGIHTGAIIGIFTAVSNPMTTTYKLKKNTALNDFMFVMYDDDTNLPATGLTITGQTNKDGAGFVALTNTPEEMSNGAYKIDLAAADLNGNVILLRFTAISAQTLFITLVLQE